MLYTSVVPHGRCKKLHCPWSGPFKALKKVSEVTYRIQRCEGRKQRLVVHFNQLKLCPQDIRGKSMDGPSSPDGATDASVPKQMKQSVPSSDIELIPEDFNADDEDKEDGNMDNQVTSDDQQTISLEQFGESELGDQQADSAIISQQSSNESSPEGIEVSRRYPLRTHQPPSGYDNYVHW